MIAGIIWEKGFEPISPIEKADKVWEINKMVNEYGPQGFKDLEYELDCAESAAYEHESKAEELEVAISQALSFLLKGKIEEAKQTLVGAV